VQDIKIRNNKVSSTALMLQYTGLYVKHFRVANFLNKAECTNRIIITRPTFMHQRSF